MNDVALPPREDPPPLAVKSSLGDYRVRFVGEAGLAAGMVVSPSFVVIDANVWRLHGEGCLRSLAEEDVVTLPVEEHAKVYTTVERLYDMVVGRSAKRTITIVSVGGGITQDITGYFASTLYRGVRWVFVPTTLLAMADSCIGGKTSLNHGDHKNLLGTMYTPAEILVHVPFVRTLAAEDYASGLGEVVKLHLLGGQKSLDTLQALLPALLTRHELAVERAIASSLRIKRRFIEKDEFDRGLRNLLNFGHCFGHAIESATGFAVPHGQAVVLGMLLAGEVARRRELLPVAEEEALRATLLRVLVSRPRLSAAERELVVQAMAYDKKRTGNGLALVLLKSGLRAERVDDLTPSEAVAALVALPDLLEQ